MFLLITSRFDTKLFEAAEAAAIAKEEAEELRRQLAELEAQRQQALDELHQKDLEVCCVVSVLSE